MRKDYLASDGSSGAETEFVEDYWTRVWEREGGPKGALSKIPGREEYRIMRPWLDKLGVGARLVDAGCGLGDWTLALTGEGFPTLGLDLSRKTVAQLRERFPDIDFRAGDIRDTGLDGGSVDGVFSWGVFEHFEDGPQACLTEAHRILRPGGMIFLSTPMDNLRHALKACGPLPAAAAAAAAALRFYQYRFTPRELSVEVARAGFDVLAAHAIHKRQGVLRGLHHELGLPYEWLLTRGLAAALAPLLPGGLIAHMVLVVARKPAAP